MPITNEGWELHISRATQVWPRLSNTIVVHLVAPYGSAPSVARPTLLHLP